MKHRINWRSDWNEGGAIEVADSCSCGIQGTDPRIYKCIKVAEGTAREE